MASQPSCNVVSCMSFMYIHARFFLGHVAPCPTRLCDPNRPLPPRPHRARIRLTGLAPSLVRARWESGQRRGRWERGTQPAAPAYRNFFAHPPWVPLSTYVWLGTVLYADVPRTALPQLYVTHSSFGGDLDFDLSGSIRYSRSPS